MRQADHFNGRGRLFSLVMAFVSFVTGVETCDAGNPFITSIYTADPSAHVWADGRLYVYPSRDVDPARGCDLMDKYHVFSTDDMVHWRDEGQVLEATQVKWGRPEGGFMWAPDCAFKNGKYYFYFPHPSGTKWNDTWKIGVAVSDKPASGFVPADEPIKGLGGFAMIDPAVFVDDDGQAYMYFGGGGKCQGGKLQDNMTELDGEMTPMAGLEDFHEAAWVFKRKGIYYLTYADNTRGQNQLRYATSTGPLGPWQSKGVYLGGTGSDTNHGSVVEYKGQWYQFYHNQSVSGRGNLRSICVDKLSFNPDGSIQQVVQTKEGVAVVEHRTPATVSAMTFSAKTAVLAGKSVLVENAAAPGGACVQNLHAADASCEFRDVDGGATGRATIEVVYSAAKTARFRLNVNGVDHSFINAIETGGWDAFTGRAAYTVTLKPGKSNTVTLTGGNGSLNVCGLIITPIPGD